MASAPLGLSDAPAEDMFPILIAGGDAVLFSGLLMFDYPRWMDVTLHTTWYCQTLLVSLDLRLSHVLLRLDCMLS